jgi:hypothetical protein
MICSFPNLLRLICPSPYRGGLYLKTWVFSGCRPAYRLPNLHECPLSDDKFNGMIDNIVLKVVPPPVEVQKHEERHKEVLAEVGINSGEFHLKRIEPKSNIRNCLGMAKRDTEAVLQGRAPDAVLHQ